MKCWALLRFFVPVVAIACLSQVLSFRAAVAPEVNRQAMGGRTIASFQEEDFNRRLDRLEQCYGVKLDVREAGVERRRSCKVVVVQRLEAMLGSNRYFSRPVKLVCRDTSAGARAWQDWEGTAVYAFAPNREQQILEELEKQFVANIVSTQFQAREIQTACNKHLQCRRNFSFSCLWDNNAKRRRLLHEALASRLFRAPAAMPALLPELLQP